MFTTIDKAVAAFLSSLLTLAAIYFDIDIAALGLTPEGVASIVAALAPVVVWAIPNKPAG